MTGFRAPAQFKRFILSPPRIELGTLRVLSAGDDHYTTETHASRKSYLKYLCEVVMKRHDKKKTKDSSNLFENGNI